MKSNPTTVADRLGLLVGRVRSACSLPWLWEARLRGVEVRGRVVFLGRPLITRAPGSTLILGGDNRIASCRRCNAIGNSQPCVLRTLAPGARLEIGAGVGLSSTVLVAAASIVIGRGSIFGAGAMVIDNDFHHPSGEFGWDDSAAEGARPVEIGRGCFIGARAIILKGVTIGDRAVVGAGAVVTKPVPAGMLAVGNPARHVPLRS